MTISSVREDVEKQKLSYFPGRSVSRYKHFRKNLSSEIEEVYILCPSNTIPRNVPRRTQVCAQGDP